MRYFGVKTVCFSTTVAAGSAGAWVWALDDAAMAASAIAKLSMPQVDSVFHTLMLNVMFYSSM
jgi:hypothetical protein